MSNDPENNQVKIGGNPGNDGWYQSEPEKKDGPMARIFAAVFITGLCTVVGAGLAFMAWVRRGDTMDGSPLFGMVCLGLVGFVVGLVMAFIVDRAMNSGK